jgi:hypothetical protein
MSLENAKRIEVIMEWLIPLLAASGFFILWVFVLSKFKGGT